MGTGIESGVESMDRYRYSLKSDRPCISGLGSEWVVWAQLSGVASLAAPSSSVPHTRVCSFIDALLFSSEGNNVEG